MSDHDHRPTIADVERVLATGSPWLRFPPAIEARFEQDTGRARCRFLIICGLVTLVVFDLHLVRDYAMIGDVFGRAVLVRIGVLTPLALVVFAVLSRNPPAWLREGMEAALMVAVVAGLLWVLLASRSPLAAHAHYSLLLVLAFPNIVQRLRFWYACVASMASLLLSAAAIPHIAGLPPAAAAGALMTLLTTAILTLVANYSLERQQRRAYLVGLHEQLRGQALMRDNARLSAMSTLDPLTGLSNRRHLETVLDTLWTSTQPGDVAILMLDIDHFKRFNDRYGHQAGDDCLRLVAALARNQLREGEDLIARFGGEEFVIVLPGLGLHEGLEVAERIRASVQGCNIGHADAPRPGCVTVSLGVAAAASSAAVDHQALIAAADAALYRAKDRGRNRVAAADPARPAGRPPMPRPATANGG